MPLVITPRPLRLTRIHCVAAWICAISLVIVLANRFPRMEGSDGSSWVPSAPSHITAKVMAEDFFVLQSPSAVRILLPRSVPVRIEVSEELPVVSILLDNRLFTRPPPAV
jgi:hypothetical protein